MHTELLQRSVLGPVPLDAEERGVMVSSPYPQPCSPRARKRGAPWVAPYVDAHVEVLRTDSLAIQTRSSMDLYPLPGESIPLTL